MRVLLFHALGAVRLSWFSLGGDEGGGAGTFSFPLLSAVCCGSTKPCRSVADCFSGFDMPKLISSGARIVVLLSVPV